MVKMAVFLVFEKVLLPTLYSSTNLALNTNHLGARQYLLKDLMKKKLYCKTGIFLKF